jgi:ribosomal-protein-alanine N-acetyltransferase
MRLRMTTDPTPVQEISTEHPTDLQVVGENFMLRLAVPDDAEQLFQLGEDPAVTRFFSWGPYTSIEQPLKYIEDLQAKRDNGSLLEFVIVERETDQIVGVTGLTEFSKRDHRAVVGSWLGHKYWGTGVNVASKSLVLGLGFRQLGLERISSYSHVRNGRSKAALERIGFVAEGILHGWHWHRGEPQDVNIHCLLREIYERSEIGSDEIEISGTVPPAFLPD